MAALGLAYGTDLLLLVCFEFSLHYQMVCCVFAMLAVDGLNLATVKRTN